MIRKWRMLAISITAAAGVFGVVATSFLAMPSTACACSDTAADMPGYVAKDTPDTLLDYRPALAGAVAALPRALPALLRAHAAYAEAAVASPGHWRDGAIMLGADPRDYVPSDAELMAAETGARIAAAAHRTGIDGRALTYRRFSFRHVDVMGSGRYFYASPPRTITLSLANG